MKLPLITLCLLSFILINAVEAYKEYCGGKKFLPNKDQYPHLHCDNSFFTLSYRGGNDHVNFIGRNGPQCSNVRKVLASPSEYDDFDRYEDIKNGIEAFNRDYCGGITVARNKNEEWLVEEYPVFEDNSNHKEYYQDGKVVEYRKPYNNRKEYAYDQEYNEEQGYEVERKPYWRMRRDYHKKRF
uniref:Uncharacterized protein n=1 Tax=Amphimedon queenslandica TaxID=400682 RepID=A0A1X7U4B4_AMPQE